jgi:hypothetical protein
VQTVGTTTESRLSSKQDIYSRIAFAHLLQAFAGETNRNLKILRYDNQTHPMSRRERSAIKPSEIAEEIRTLGALALEAVWCEPDIIGSLLKRARCFEIRLIHYTESTGTLSANCGNRYPALGACR